MNDKTIYEHLGESSVDSDREYIQSEIGSFKPQGWWASPKDSKYNWRNWCKANDFRFESLEHHVEFTLKDSSKILRVDSVESLGKILKQYRGHLVPDRMLPVYNFFAKKYVEVDFNFNHYIDFLKISKEYDGFEVLISSDPRLYYVMYGYDVDSLVLWNLDVVEIL